MRTSLSYLPEQKQHEIQAITETIVKAVEPVMVILFGSYARGTFVEDRYVEDHITYEYISDYDVLVIVEDERRSDIKEKHLRNALRKYLHHRLPVQVIVHGIDHVNEALEEGQYFFSDIVKDGVMLFETGKFQLANPKFLSEERRKKISKDYFDKWYVKADEFLDSASTDFEKKKLAISIFLLHQATESFFNCIELVFTHYKPKTHDLRQLYKNVMVLDDRFKVVFPLNTEEEKRLFKLLTDAYIDSRYKMNYSLEESDLRYLFERVKNLKELTETICFERIN